MDQLTRELKQAHRAAALARLSGAATFGRELIGFLERAAELDPRFLPWRWEAVDALRHNGGWTKVYVLLDRRGQPLASGVPVPRSWLGALASWQSARAHTLDSLTIATFADPDKEPVLLARQIRETVELLRWEADPVRHYEKPPKEQRLVARWRTEAEALAFRDNGLALMLARSEPLDRPRTLAEQGDEASDWRFCPWRGREYRLAVLTRVAELRGLPCKGWPVKVPLADFEAALAAGAYALEML